MTDRLCYVHDNAFQIVKACQEHCQRQQSVNEPQSILQQEVSQMRSVKGLESDVYVESLLELQVNQARGIRQGKPSILVILSS